MTESNHVLSAICTLLSATGDTATREGLLETPLRVQRAYGEWFSGYGADPSKLFKVFEDGANACDEMVLVANIPVYSHCEHHMAPFWGLAHLAYIPAGKILGLSKFVRLVDIFARRLQVQERLTNQVADCLVENMKPLGVGVVFECRHMCLESRGAKTRGSITYTSALRGAIKSKDSSRSEFFSLVRAASKAKDGL